MLMGESRSWKENDKHDNSYLRKQGNTQADAALSEQSVIAGERGGGGGSLMFRRQALHLAV